MDNKKEIEQKIKELKEKTTSFCNQYLNDEYQKLSEKLIDKLYKKRNVPFITGKIDVWAGAIIYSLGQINFLFDKSLQPNIKQSIISEYFNLKINTVSQKAKLIRDLLNMSYYNKEFSTEYMNNNKPLDEIRIVDKSITYPNKYLLDFRLSAFKFFNK